MQSIVEENKGPLAETLAAGSLLVAVALLTAWQMSRELGHPEKEKPASAAG